ncbi:hypothetical protein PENTCL1PPCAC_24824, partial [Pristionchus entomophagus]
IGCGSLRIPTFLPSLHYLTTLDSPPSSSSTPSPSQIQPITRLNMASRLIKLKSADDQDFEVSRDVIKQSNTVNTLITDLGMDDEDSAMNDAAIPLPKVDAAILTIVIDWCERHKDDPQLAEEETETAGNEATKKEVPQADKDWFVKLDQIPLWNLTLAANYLDIKLLLEQCCRSIADMMRGKDASGIRNLFGVENDFTPAEEESIKKENAWCEN